MANSLIESRRRIILNSPHIASGSGSIVTVNDAIKAKLKSCVVDINPVQEGTGDPSPDNILPISGWTGCNVTRSGNNIFNYNDRASTDNYYLDSTGTPVSSINYYTSNFIKVKPSTYYFYTINGVPKKTHANHMAPRIAYYTEQKEYISSGDAIGYGNSFLTPENCVYIKVPVYTKYDAHLSAMITEGTTSPTTYSAFGTTYPITFPSEAATVYGADLNPLIGELTVTHEILDIGLTEYEWKKGTYAFYLTNLENMKSACDIICSCYKSNRPGTGGANMPNFSVNSTHNSIYLKDSNLMQGTVDEMREALTGQKIVYELATPLTYQLTPTQIDTLLGTNNIWADTGDTSVKYWAHP